MSEEEQAPSLHVEGPAAVGGDVIMSGENVAGRDLVTNVDRSVNVRALLAIWGGRRRSELDTARELHRARRALLDEVRRNWVEGELDRSLVAAHRMELGLAELHGP